MDESYRLPPIRHRNWDPPQSTVSWTAINNHPSDTLVPVSPPTHPANAHTTASPSPHSHYPEHHHPSQGPPHHHHHQENPLAPIDHSRARVDSASRSPRSSLNAVGKPITPERQDSFLLPLSQSASIIPQTASFHSQHSPESHHRNLLREPVTHPPTPPSDPVALQAHSNRLSTDSSTNDRHHEFSPLYGHQEAAGSNLQSRHPVQLSPIKTPMVPHPQATCFEHQRDSMPPPPPPPAPVPALSTSPTRPTAALHSSTSTNVATTQTTPRHMQDPLDVEKGNEERCSHCKETWTYPPLDVKRLDLKQAEGINEMHANMDRMHAFTNNYIASKNADYAKWKQQHCHCNESRPGGSKRKPEESLDDHHPASKYQKRSSESPSRRSRLTPPPEQVCPVGSPDREPQPNSIVYKPEHGVPIQISQTSAMLTGIHGAPRPAPYERPANDSTNMWGYSQSVAEGVGVNGGKGKGIKVEEITRS